MSDADARRERLRVALEGAQAALAELSDEWAEENTGEGRNQLEHLLTYAQLVVAATDPRLVSDTAINELEAATSAITAAPEAAVLSPDTYAARVIDATLRLPGARGRDIEQSLLDAAVAFERNARDRLDALRQRYAVADKKFDDVSARADAIEQRIAELETSLAANRTELDTMLQRHSGEFTAAQEERAKEYQEEAQAIRAELSQLQEEARKEVESRVAEIRRMEEESAGLVGAIGLAGTAERYGEEVVQQRVAADRWRWATIVFALGAVGIGLYAVLAGDQEPEALIAKLAVSAVLGGLAAYTASQSGRHRRREERARALQLELTAFAPFIEPLDPAQREEERVLMTRRTFGRAINPEGSPEDPGPSPISFLLRCRQKALDEGTE
jgi:hypothetical protein